MRIALTLVLAIASAVSVTAPAAVFSVDTGADAVDAAPGDGACASSGGRCTLRAAVQEANALIGADTIQLGARTHGLAIPGVKEALAAKGDLDVRQDLVVEGENDAVTVVDGGQLDRVFELHLGAKLTLRDLTVCNGRVMDESGGGIQMYTADPAAELRLERVRVTGNQALGAGVHDGGGISTGSFGLLVIRDSTLDGNEAVRGGAIHADVPVDMEGATVAGNHAGAGSALYLNAATFLDRSTIAGNSGPGNYTVIAGGSFTSIKNTTLSANVDPAAILYAYSGDVQLRNATIVGNDAADAIRIASGAALDLANTIVVNPLVEQECGGEEAALSHGHNLDSDSTCAAFGPGDYHTLDPGLGPLAANGGPTPTHAPLPGSLAIDRGDLAYCPTLDQRGVARPVDGDGDDTPECDIGAVEYTPEAGALGASATAVAGVFALAHRRRSSNTDDGGSSS